MILHAALVPLLLLAAVPAAAEPTCRAAVVAEAAPEAIRLANGDVFLPDGPFDALEISSGDVVFACEDHLFESESLFPISGRWANRETQSLRRSGAPTTEPSTSAPPASRSSASSKASPFCSAVTASPRTAPSSRSLDPTCLCL